MKTRLALFLAVLATLTQLLPASAIQVVIDVNDRPYAIHGPVYYVAGVRYVWIPGHWNRRHSRWVRGHYVVR